jgi:AcrR family transcriptional regulator
MSKSGPYHHGNLRQALLDAALIEIEQFGPAALSLREVARRARVSHAAPTHHFGDKAGLFTAIATEGFRRIRDATSAAAVGDDALLRGGIAYIGFAVSNRAYFEVMFRPDLYRADDPELMTARDGAFEVLFGAVEAALNEPEPQTVMATTIAAWSETHGLAVLWSTGNLPTALTTEPMDLASLMAEGMVRLGEIARRQAPSAIRSVLASSSDEANDYPRRRRKTRG